MKNFVKENWYKLMVGSSMMMASFGFMMYAISPVYSNSEFEKSEMKNEVKLKAPVGTNGVIVDDYAYFVDGGYVYSIDSRSISYFARGGGKNYMGTEYKWVGSEFLTTFPGFKSEVCGRKTKLP